MLHWITHFISQHWLMFFRALKIVITCSLSIDLLTEGLLLKSAFDFKSILKRGIKFLSEQSQL